MNKAISFFKQYYFYIFPLLLTLGLYALLFGIFYVNDVDNPWSSAWIYNFFHHHMTYDLVFCDGDPNYWGVRFFSQIFCYVYGAILSIIGFSLHKIQLISHGFVFLGLFTWFCIAKVLLKDTKLAFMFVILLAMSDSTFQAANEARSDAFIFFLLGSSFLLWLQQRYFLSILLAFIGVETHPIGGLIFFYLFSYFICYDKSLILKPSFLLKCSVALVFGVSLYLFFHYAEMANLHLIYGHTQDNGVNNFIYAYFYKAHHLQNIRELILFTFASIIYFIRFKTKKLYFSLSILLLILSSFVFARANPHYFLFIYPALWLFIISSFAVFRNQYFKFEYVFILLLLLDTHHYLNLASHHAPVRQFNQYITQVQSLNLPKDSYIYSDPVDYFAFYNYPGFRAVSSSKQYHHFYLIEHIGTVFSDDHYPFDISKWSYTKIKTLHLQSGGSLNVYEVDKQP